MTVSSRQAHNTARRRVPACRPNSPPTQSAAARGAVDQRGPHLNDLRDRPRSDPAGAGPASGIRLDALQYFLLEASFLGEALRHDNAGALPAAATDGPCPSVEPEQESPPQIGDKALGWVTKKIAGKLDERIEQALQVAPAASGDPTHAEHTAERAHAIYRGSGDSYVERGSQLPEPQSARGPQARPTGRKTAMSNVTTEEPGFARWARLTIVAALAALLLAPSAASAASIVFIKDNNVWLSAPNGSNERQVTTGGDWSFPSQADDGTIMATRGTQLFRLNRSGNQLAPPIITTFTYGAADWLGPVGDVISPDGVNQAYDGEILTSPICDPICTSANEFLTLWGSATTFSQPNQTLGQEDYVDPAWIDSSHLLLTSVGVLIAQVATYTLGGGNNTEFQWFSDRGAQSLNDPAITPSGDKLAFIANVNDRLDNEIRLYQTTGPPPEAAGDPANLPIDECNLGPNNFSSYRVSFSPDGQSLAYDAPNGIHLLTLTGWPRCQGFTDKLIIPGGAFPYFGPADAGPNVHPSVSNVFQVAERAARGGQITLTLSATAAGTFTAHASAKVGSGRHTSTYGSSSVRVHHKGLVKLTIKPTASAARALALAGRMVVSVTITFTPTGGTPRVKHRSLTVLALRKRAK